MLYSISKATLQLTTQSILISFYHSQHLQTGSFYGSE